MHSNYIEKLINTLLNVIITKQSLSEKLEYEDAINFLVVLLMKARTERNQIFFVGNGGSAGIALHMAADYQKTAMLCTQTFYDQTLLTCMGNDCGYESIFSKPIEICANSSDFLIAISSSGQSANILNAVKAAKEKKCNVITLSGFQSDNPLRMMGDVNIYVPISEYGIVESIHNLILQQIVDEIKDIDKKEDR